MTEQERMDGKLERLLRRNEKVLFEIMKSKISKKSKLELYGVYASMIGGMCFHLEDKYPFLKETPHRCTNQSANASDSAICQKEGDSEGESASK
ncbi:MAG: hypothetical protein QXZ70_07895 [Candidatus Bathyarchaeia archaeon]